MVELTALSSRSGRAIATFLNFYVSHGSTASITVPINFLLFLQTVNAAQNCILEDRGIVK